MANDIMIISGSGARVAARLCNFETGEKFLLGSHINWLDQNVAPIIRSQPNSWVDLHGYASKRGDTKFNDYISQQRCDSAKSRIINYANRINFNIYRAYGASESGSNPSNNDGYWRAIDIYVFSAEPSPKPKQPPLDELNTVRRIVHREFTDNSAEGDNLVSPDPLAEDARQNTKGIMAVFGSVVNSEASLGNETKAALRITAVPVDFLVNRVTFDQTVIYQRSTFGSTTSVNTKIDYEWGPPSPLVRERARNRRRQTDDLRLF